jgi:hypothetical protein
MVDDQLVEKGSAQFNLGSHFNQGELRGLGLGERPAGYNGVFTMGNDPFEDAFSRGYGAEGGDQPFLLQLLHEHEKSHAFVADTVGDGDPTFGEE